MIRRVNLVVDILSKVSFFEVLLGLDAQNRFCAIGECFVNTLILSALWPSRVDEPEDDIGITQSGEGLSIDKRMDLMGFLAPKLFLCIMMDTRSIEEYDLETLCFVGKNPWNRPLSGLRTM